MNQTPPPHKKRAHIIVVGNEKGGSGKTTTSMHVIVSLMRLGFSAGTIDIDSRQRSFSRYLENRRHHMMKHGSKLPLPHHIVLNRSPFSILEEAEEDERTRFNQAINHLAEENDFVLVDSPGADQFMARLAHSWADTVITPINDSFIDLDVIAALNPDSMEVIKPSVYSEMLWEQKLTKAKQNRGPIDWVVMRNRLSNLDAKNKRRMAEAVEMLAKRIGFRVAPGFSERVIFRELFLQGLTVMDLTEDPNTGVTLSMSHIAAREEVRGLLKTLDIPKLNEAMQRKTREQNENNAADSGLGTKGKPSEAKDTDHFSDADDYVMMKKPANSNGSKPAELSKKAISSMQDTIADIKRAAGITVEEKPAVENKPEATQQPSEVSSTSPGTVQQ